MYYLIREDCLVLKATSITNADLYDFHMSNGVVINAETNEKLVDVVENNEDDIYTYQLRWVKIQDY